MRSLSNVKDRRCRALVLLCTPAPAGAQARQFSWCGALQPTAIHLARCRGAASSPIPSPSSTPSTTTPQSATDRAWREYIPEEQLQCIDLLTFELGQYPEQRRQARRPQTTAPPPATAAGKEAGHTTGGAPGSGSNQKKRVSARSKFASMDAMTAKQASTTTTTTTSSLPTALSTGRETAAAAAAAAALVTTLGRVGGGGDVHTDAMHPCTPYAAMARIVADALAAADQDGDEHAQGISSSNGVGASHAGSQVRDEEGHDLAAEYARVTTHPPGLFSDEAQVLRQFGMGGSTSPTAPGFDGLFRQRWQDFHVTEMVADPTAPIGGAMLSRDLDFTVPPLPEELVSGLGGGGGGGEGVVAAEARRDERHNDKEEEEEEEEEEQQVVDAEGPDQSFFEVDVASHLASIRSESVRTKARAAAVRSKAREPLGEVEFERGIAAALEGHKTRMAALEKREAALVRDIANNNSTNHLGRHNQQQRRQSKQQGGSGKHHRHSARYYLQCTLHKQHVAHSAALASVAQILRVHPRAITVAGIKDFIGDTVQRVRIEHVSPVSALEANRIFVSRRDGRTGRPLQAMTLSDFSYQTAPLAPGDLFGNHFRIVLRDVRAPAADVTAALAAFEQRGFPNYYGCQRFSWFAGGEDAAFALLRQNWLAFAFRFLNFTGQDRSLRALLQREKKYPHPVQDEYRRNIVRRLREIAVEPHDLDEAPFMTCPGLADEAALTGDGGGPLNTQQELIVWQLREAYFDLHAQSRRLSAQRLSSFLWNQVLTLRLHHFGGTALLEGDHVAPAALRRAASTVWDRKETHQSFNNVVSADNRAEYTIADVVHPGFSFEGIALPANPVGTYYRQVCAKYRLDWAARHTRGGISDFREPPRPIVRHPLNLSHEYNTAESKLTVCFALERGCYANVAITELMKLARCAGSEAVTVLPLPDVQWAAMGERDPGYVTALQDIYKGYEDGVGFTGDTADVGFAPEFEKRVWDLEGPLFLPDEEDPFRKAHKWGSKNLLRNSERRESDRAAARRQLFEAPLARRMGEEELAGYAGHTVPMQPNAKGKRVFFKVLRRNRRYAGAPRAAMRLKRGAQSANRSHRLPAFKTLNKDSWNVSW